MFHEILHLNLAADSEGGRPNPEVEDLHITYSYRDTDGTDREVEDPAYEPARAKLLARFKPERFNFQTGYYVQRNCESLYAFVSQA